MLIIISLLLKRVFFLFLIIIRATDILFSKIKYFNRIFILRVYSWRRKNFWIFFLLLSFNAVYVIFDN